MKPSAAEEPAFPAPAGLRQLRLRLLALSALGVGLSVAVFLVAQESFHRRQEAVLQREISLFTAAMEGHRRGAEDVLASLRLVLHQDPDLPREFFHDVAGLLASRLDVVQALTWAPRVRAADRAAWEAHGQGPDAPPRRIMEGDLIHPDSPPVPAGEREEYFPVLYVEPLQGNEAAHGYDVASVPEIRAALDLARDEGRVRLSQSVRLPYEGNVDLAVVAAGPVYRGSIVPPTLEARREALVGYALTVVFPKLMLGTVQERLSRSHLEVVLLERQADDSYLRLVGGPETLPRTGTGAEFRQSFGAQAVQEWTVAGAEWMALFRPDAGWNPGPARWFPWILLVAGLLFTGLVLQHLRNSLARTLEVEGLVRERTAELAETNRQLQREGQERVRAQDALAHERNLLRMLLDRLPDAVHVASRDGRYLMLNDAHARLLQIDGEREGLGRLVRDVGARVLATELDAGSNAALRMGTAELGRESTIRLAPDREIILLTSRLPLRNAQGEIEGLVVLARDVTESRRVAREQAEFSRRLQETQKFESLGLLAGGIAHDFNNLLTTIIGNVGLARMDLPADSTAQECLNQIESTSLRAADLCKQMLAYSGKGRFVIRRLDLSAVVEETTELLRLSVSKKSRLTLELAPELPAVAGDSTQLRQILMNLVSNASDAVGERGGSITITTGVTTLDRAQLETAALSAAEGPGAFVFLEVRDDGCGMNPDTMARVFDPFFTTKFTGRGLGLAAVLGIVRGHRGVIRMESGLGKGTRFTVLLPRTEGAPERILSRPTAEAWRGSGRVLVVDDEVALRNIAARLLEKAGFGVDLAADGREAVEKFAAEPDGYRAVLLDLTMPNMDGEEAFREIRRIRPKARVLLMSGFSHQEAVDRFAGKGLGGFIQKPFGPQQLYDALQALLEDKGAWSEGYSPAP